MNSFSHENPKYRCCFQSLHVRTGTVIISFVHVIIYCTIFWHCVKVASIVFGHRAARPAEPASKFEFRATTNASEVESILLNSDNVTEFDLIDRSIDLQNINTTNGTGTLLERSIYKTGFRDIVPSMSSAMLLLASFLSAVFVVSALVKTSPILLVPEIVLIIANIITFLLLLLFCVIALAVDSSELNSFIKNQLRNDANLRDLPETTAFLAHLAAGFGVVVFLSAVGIEMAFFRIVKLCYVYLKDKKSFIDDHPAGVRYFAIDEHDPDADETSAVAIVDSSRRLVDEKGDVSVRA